MARLIGAEFIRYASRFPKAFEASAELPAVPFTEAVRRVSLVADRTTPVQLTFRRDVTVIEAQSDGRARAMESVPVGFVGPDRVISFNPHYLLDGLAAAMLTAQAQPAGGGDDPARAPGRIRLQFTSPAKPALITWAGGDAQEGAEASGRAAAEVPDVPGQADTEPDDDPADFRYLVVPLRTPAGG